MGYLLLALLILPVGATAYWLITLLNQVSTDLSNLEDIQEIVDGTLITSENEKGTLKWVND